MYCTNVFWMSSRLSYWYYLNYPNQGLCSFFIGLQQSFSLYWTEWLRYYFHRVSFTWISPCMFGDLLKINRRTKEWRHTIKRTTWNLVRSRPDYNTYVVARMIAQQKMHVPHPQIVICVYVFVWVEYFTFIPHIKMLHPVLPSSFLPPQRWKNEIRQTKIKYGLT